MNGRKIKGDSRISSLKNPKVRMIEIKTQGVIWNPEEVISEGRKKKYSPHISLPNPNYITRKFSIQSYTRLNSNKLLHPSHPKVRSNFHLHERIGKFLQLTAPAKILFEHTEQNISKLRQN